MHAARPVPKSNCQAVRYCQPYGSKLFVIGFACAFFPHSILVSYSVSMRVDYPVSHCCRYTCKRCMQRIFSGNHLPKPCDAVSCSGGEHLAAAVRSSRNPNRFHILRVAIFHRRITRVAHPVSGNVNPNRAVLSTVRGRASRRWEYFIHNLDNISQRCIITLTIR